MDKRLFVAWTNFTHHRINCQNRCRWLDVFLRSMLEEEQTNASPPPFFRGISSVMVEQLLHDLSLIGLSSVDTDKEKLSYCLQERGWILLHAMASSDLRSVTGAAELTDVLIRLYETQGSGDVTNRSALIPSWPLTDLAAIVARTDLKSCKKKLRIKQLKRSSPRSNIMLNNPSVDYPDGLLPEIDCCGEEQITSSGVTADEVHLPSLPVESFRQLVLTLLEQLAGHQGNVRLKSNSFLDEALLTFSLQHLQRNDTCEEEQRRLLRLSMRSLVSLAQYHRSFSADEVVQQLIDVAASSESTLLIAEIAESLVRFLAAIHPIDDELLFHQWLNGLHNPTCLRLVAGALDSDVCREASWISLMGSIIITTSVRMGNVPCHHQPMYGRALSDPAQQMDQQSCSISSLFYFLLQMYRTGGERARRTALETMARAHPCCCLPVDLICEVLFESVLELPDFVTLLEVVFRSTGFVKSTVETHCHFCRNNGGQELERCRRMGVYASTESLSHTAWKPAYQSDPWRSFDRITDYVLERLDLPFALTMVKRLNQQLASDATAHVQSEMWSRMLYPLLAQSSDGVSRRPSRTSVAGQMAEVCWQTTAYLVQLENISELFLTSNGLELLLDYCRSSEWSLCVSNVFQSLISVQLKPSVTQPDLEVERMHAKLPSLGNEGTALTTFEQLLLRFTRCTFSTLSPSRNHSDDQSVSSLDSDTEADHIKTTCTLWAAVVRLLLRNRPFASWFPTSELCHWVDRAVDDLSQYLSQPSAPRWNLYLDLLEIFLTVSFLTGSIRLEHVLAQFTPQNNLSVVYEAVLRCATLERWMSPNKPNSSSGGDRQTDGYEADEEAAEEKYPPPRPNLFIPAVIPQLLLNFVGWHSKMDEEGRGVLFLDFAGAFTRIAALCSHPSTAAILHEFDVLRVLLCDMKQILLRTDPPSSSLRSQLLGMVTCLGHQKLTPVHLQLLLDLLKEENPPWKDVLPVLLHLIQQAGSQPTHRLAFPSVKAPDEQEDDSLQHSTGSIGSFVQLNDIRWEIFTLAKNAKDLGRLHDGKGVRSAWSNAAVFLPILSDHNWNMQSDGISLSMWFFLADTVKMDGCFTQSEWNPDLFDWSSGTIPHQRPDSPARESRDFHMFSVGSRGFLIEFWADPTADKTLMVRLSQSNHSSSQTLASQTLDLRIPTGRWNQMVVNCRQKSSGSQRTVNIQIIVNGCSSVYTEIKSPLPTVKRTGNLHSFVLLGTIASVPQSTCVHPTWYLGHTTLYKGDILSPEMAVLLMTLGADGGVFITSCLDGQLRPNLPRFLHPKLVSRAINWEQILDSDKLMEQLQTKVLLTYSAHNPDSVFLYPCIISPTAGLLGSLHQGGCVFNSVSTDPRSSQQPPISLSAAMAAPLSAQIHVGVRSAVKKLGGYSILLFLLGYSVESQADSSLQAKALEILLHWLRCDAQERRLFSSHDGLWMLQRVLETERCLPGKHMAAVLLNLSCSTSVVNSTAHGVSHSDVVIVDPDLLAFTIQCWKHWQRHPDRAENESDTLDLVLRALQHLLRDNHPHRPFNVLQMERAGVLRLLLHMAKECSLYQEWRRLTEHQAAQVADLVEGLLGSPPSLEALASVVDYLLLLHPAALMYTVGSTGYFTLSNRDAGADVFRQREWKLPDGYEMYAPEITNPQPMNANRLGSALRDVIVKWSDEMEGDKTRNLKMPAELSPNPPRTNNLSNRTRTEADATVSLHLLRILTACVRVLPDSMVKSVVGGVFRPEMAVVLARHQRDRMRAAAIRLLQALLARSEEEEQKFIRQSGMILLSNQLQPYVATNAVVEACLSLCVGVDVMLEQVTDPFTIWPEDPTPLQLQSTVLLLSLLPNAALDPALFHQLATLIRILATSVPVLKFLLDFGLVETLAKCIVAVAHANKHCPSDVLEQREDEILMEAIHRLLILITTRIVSASGAAPWLIFQDMIHLFNYVERVESGLCGPKARCVQMLRESGCIILKQAIQTVQLRAEFQVHLGPTHGSLLFVQQPGTCHFQHVSDRMLTTIVPASLYRKLKLDKPASQSEVFERFRYLLVKAVDHVTLNAELNFSTVEIAFSQELLLTLVRGLSSILERPRSSNGLYNWSPDSSVDWSHYHPPDSADPARSLFWNSRQTLKSQLNRMLLFLSSPVQDPSFLYFVIRTLHDDPRHEELFKLIPANESDFTYKLDTYLCHFLHSRNCADDVEHSTLIRIHCISRCLVPFYPRRRCQVLDLTQLKQQLEEERMTWWRQQEELQARILSRYDLLMRASVDVASRWTVQTVEAQHDVRRTFLDRLRRDHAAKVQAADGWARLAEQMTHPRACWHFSRAYFRGWQLDPTEGYQRTHVRLERCPLQIDAKYLLERSHALLEPESVPQPLAHILQLSSSGNLKSVDDIGCEKIVRVVDCCVVTPAAETPAEWILTERWMSFLLALSSESYCAFQPASAVRGRIRYDDIREVVPRRFQLQDRALELFFADHRTLFVVMGSCDERNAVLRQLGDLCTKLLPTESLAEVTQLWREHQITNFEYLVFLNKMAGRSYNDLMQYPIFPFILADYESSVLNLDDPHIYRNFKKPMAVQNENRDRHYIENYNYLKRDFENRPDGAGPNFGPFHYGSLYSNPGIVLHFLVRLPPFTKLLMDYQDRNFDVPDRSFHSVGTSWRLASSDSTTDVKELIPEFFYLPEFLVNSLGFDFGMQQSGESVDDVQLPPWSQGKPRLFIQIHRQALESSWVRDHLHHWIDLIFGFKQTGPAAVESINVFHPSTYASFDAAVSNKEGTNEDPIERSAKLTMIRSYGQVPRQLFRQPHPMSVQPLGAKSVPRRGTRLLSSVEHLQWGCYVGSPACQDPVLKYKECFTVPVQSFLPLRTGDTYALGPFTSAIVSHSYDKDSFLGRPTGILGVALVLWGQSDGIVRLKTRKDEPVKPLLLSQTHDDSVVHCATSPEYERIWVAYRSGLIHVHSFLFDPLRAHFELTDAPTVLVGHTGPVRQLVLCSAFSLAVSAGSDGICILWDLHRLNFIRQFSPGEQKDGVLRPVAQLAVARNTADIACAVHLSNEESLIELRSVNGSLVGTVTVSPLVTSLCFSSAPEGVSINVLAAGLSNGHIRLWDSWTLSPVRDITTDSSLSIVGLAYSNSSQHLLAARSDGILLAWDVPGNNYKRASRYPPFVNLTLQ